MDESLLTIEEDELLYKIFLQSNAKAPPVHRIISKQLADNSIKAISIFENADGERTAIQFFCGSEEEFVSNVDMIAKTLEATYEVIDFAKYKTIEDQVKMIQHHPSLFSLWEQTRTGEMRSVKVNNNFLLNFVRGPQ